MITISSILDTNQLIDNPELQREVTSYLLYCRQELLEYEDEEDIDDFNFMVLTEEDIPMLQDLGPPEETIQINIKADGHTITIYRFVYPTEVLFIPAELSAQISF